MYSNNVSLQVQQLKKQKGSMAASGQGSGAGIQEKIEQQESLINNIGLRYFISPVTAEIDLPEKSLLCILQGLFWMLR